MTPPASEPAQWQADFEDIRCYTDAEVPSVLTSLLEDPVFLQSSQRVIGDPEGFELFLQELRAVDSVEALQAQIERFIMPGIAQTYQSLNVSGLDQLDSKRPYIFISNHRDIVMDPLILNAVLKQHDYRTCHCAIGDNLLKSPTAHRLAMLNRCFKVARSMRSPKAILRAMRTQSAYIRYRHEVDKDHIWIAQKEGRSKDNSDITNPALIKMLALARTKDVSVADYLNSLNIVPVCFSYEWDPCDTDKARQLYNASESENYEKQAEEDLIAVTKGLSGNKGNIHLAFGKPIQLDTDQDVHTRIAAHIDHWIHNAYQLYPNNYAAFRKTRPDIAIDPLVDREAIHQAQKQLEERFANEGAEITEKCLQAYSMPVQYQLNKS